jgi:cytochrome c553
MRILVAVLVTGVTFFAVVSLAQEPAQSPAPFQRVGTMSQLMIDIIYPTSDAVFYIDRQPPKTEKEWNDFRGQALMLAESGNLLMMEGRARDQDQWMKDAKLLVDVGAAAVKAARAKDVDAILALNDQLYAACVTCHEQYRPNYGKRKLGPVQK